MYTVKSIITQLTDPKIVLSNVSEMLKIIDPSYAQEEKQYQAAVKTLEETLGDSVTPSVRSYINAKERVIAAELVYVGWLGFQQNRDCFENPINTMFLKADYEDFHRERRMHTLPDVQEAMKTINAFYDMLRTLPGGNMGLTEGITEFMCYLETTGFKLAHYFGFLLADSFLGHVIPGYTNDDVTTMQYTRDLQSYLQLDLGSLK